MHYFKLIQDWLTKHPLTLAALTLLAGGAISIFSGDIRQFLRIQPQRLNIWILKARMSAAESRLQRLQALYDDRRELFFVLIRTLFVLASVILWFGLAIFLEVRWAQVGYPFDRWEHTVNSVLAFIAFALGGVASIRGVQRIFELKNWERTRQRLEKKIDRLTKKVEAKALMGKAAGS